MSILKAFKNNNAPQNLFLACMTLAAIGAVIQFNWQAIIAWFCCFVIFVMLCLQRDHSNHQQKQIRDMHLETLQKMKKDSE